MIEELHARFNREYRPEDRQRLLALLEHLCGEPIDCRVAETPLFMPCDMLDAMAGAGAEMAIALIGDKNYMAAARELIPPGMRIPGQPPHPSFLSADFGLVRSVEGEWTPRLIEIRAVPSACAFQTVLGDAYRRVYELDENLGMFLGGIDEREFWTLLTRTALGTNDPAHVVVAAVDPAHRPIRADFELTARRLGISVLDLRALEPEDNRLHYRGPAGQLFPIHRLNNRATAEELMASDLRLPFDLAHAWNVEWAGHPNWHYLIGRFSLPWLSRPPLRHPMVPAAVFLDEFLEGRGREELEAAGVPLPSQIGNETVYRELVLKPLSCSGGWRVVIAPTLQQLEAIPAMHRRDFLVQRRMDFASSVQTPHGPARARIRILYLWPDQGLLTPVLPSVRLVRGDATGTNHNGSPVRDSISAIFYPR